MCHYSHFTTEEREMSRVLKAQGLSIVCVTMMCDKRAKKVANRVNLC